MAGSEPRDFSENNMVKFLVRAAQVAAAVVGPFAATSAAGPETPTAATELERMQGTWDYEIQTVGGWELPADRRAKLWGVIKGDIMTKEIGLGPGLKYRIKLDTTTSPKSIDLTSIEHPSGMTYTNVGIYEWDGKLLRLCFDNTGKDRPKEFRSPAGQDNIYVSVLRRRDK